MARPLAPSPRGFATWLLLTAIAGVASPSQAQLIPIRTVPVASGDQFRLLPSESMSMGGVHMAVDDSLADPWKNPALGHRTSISTFMGSPTFYGISQGGGGGRSFPVSALVAGSRWFGGASLAFQQIENRNQDNFFWAEPAIDVCCWGGGGPGALSDGYGRNLYASGFIGTKIGNGPWSVGLGASSGSLEAMDGVDLLYAGSSRIDQSGGISDFRLGAQREGERDRVSLLVVHNRVSMQHDVTWVDWVWNDATALASVTTRIERNEDKTRTWAGSVAWDRDLAVPGWRIGATATANRKSHPKIPNYSIQNIPRDPGTTWAWEVGVGFSMTEENSRFALDVALQPIWSTTWQEANAADVTASGGSLSVGDRSIENDFFFTNVILRSGFSHTIGSVGLQAGVEARSYDYQMEQINRVTARYRTQDESWVEWSPTFGTVVTLSGLDLRYALRATTGTGQPGTLWGGGGLETLSAADADFIIAPTGPLTLQDARVITHQVSVTIPVR